MTVPVSGRRFSWEQSPREIYEKLVHSPPDTPDYQKLLVLAQLKVAESSEKTANAVAGYTKWLMLLTAVIVVCTVVQSVVAVLTYWRSPVH
jgi:hypothetical protein